MNAEREIRAALARIQKTALLVGAAALLLALLGAISSPRQFLRSYLSAFLFWVGPALGSLALLFLHDLTGGRWGRAIRGFLMAGSKQVPLTALMFVPLLLGVKQLYPWASPEIVAADAVLQHKSVYLNLPFFTIRAAAYFGIWIALAFAVLNEPGRPGRIRLPSGPALILLGLSVTFAAIDWGMSLEPRWFSTIYALVVIMGQMLTALALAILAAAWIRRWPNHRDALTRRHFSDLGNLCLTFVLLWAYVAFSEYLIIWSGNLPEEVPWYVHRSAGSWPGVTMALVLLHFAIPFVVLLSRKAKRNAAILASVAGALLFAHFVDTYWLVQPSFFPAGIHVHWLDFLLPVGLGGLWVGSFARSLGRQSLSALPDADAAEAAEAAEGAKP